MKILKVLFIAMTFNFAVGQNDVDKSTDLKYGVEDIIDFIEMSSKEWESYMEKVGFKYERVEDGYTWYAKMISFEEGHTIAVGKRPGNKISIYTSTFSDDRFDSSLSELYYELEEYFYSDNGHCNIYALQTENKTKYKFSMCRRDKSDLLVAEIVN